MSDLELIRRALQYNLDQESDFQDNADKDLAEKALAAFDRLVSQEPAAYPRTKDGEYQISPGANRPHDRAGGHSTPWTAIYTSPLAQQEAEPVDDGAMFDWIDARARETFSRHKSVARGQQITAADNPESHLIWAALKWAEAHPPKPAALPARCEYCNGSGDVHSFDGEWLGSCTECPPAAQPQVPESKNWVQHVYWIDSSGVKHNGLHQSLNGLLSTAKEEGK